MGLGDYILSLVYPFARDIWLTWADPFYMSASYFEGNGETHAFSPIHISLLLVHYV